MKIIDLTPGIGARAIAFQKVGFKVVCAVGEDGEDAKIYNTLVQPKQFVYKSIQLINPTELPEADIIMARLIAEPRVISKNKDTHLINANNRAINDIIYAKRPVFFVLGAPVSILTRSNWIAAEKILSDYVKRNYYIFYDVFEEDEYSGYSVKGKHLYFVGIRNDQLFREPYFAEPNVENMKKEFRFEEAITINEWYRIVRPVEGTKYVQGNFYVRVSGTEKKTDLMEEGFMKEMYLMDSLGLRRITHNEIAWTKGIEGYNFNTCSNKRSMYRKLASAESVFIVEAIAASIRSIAGYNRIEIEEREDSKELFLERSRNKSGKGKKQDGEKVFFPKQRLTNIHISKLKGLKNLDLPIEKRLTAIMGVNGCGKSTILHALACAFKPHEKGNNYKFSFFFTPNPDSDWKNSSLELTYYDENEQREISRIYKKNQDRWSPRYAHRPVRDVFFVGIDTCIPEIETEKQTSFIDYSTNSLDDAAALKIIHMAADILNKDYKNLTIHKTKKKELLGVHTARNLTYSSLSMGAGEQRVLKILRLLNSVNSYSLILIDEIDLLLHVTALKKLIKVMYEVAEKKKLQIIFTTHSLEVASLKEYVDVRYLDTLEQKTMVFHSINPDIIYAMSNVVEKPIEIYVEDLLAEVIINKIATDLNILRYVRILKFGASGNAFVLAAGYILRQEEHDNVLIVLDGDVNRENLNKLEAVKKVLSGTEADHEEKAKQAVSMIKQLNLPANTEPEKHIYDMLIQTDPRNEIVRHAKRLNAVENSHGWLDQLTLRMGQSEELTLRSIIDIVAGNPSWGDYICGVQDWLSAKSRQLGLDMEEKEL